MGLLEADHPFHKLSPVQARGHVVDAIKAVFIDQSQRQPVVMVVEDLQWIDSGTEAVLDALVQILPAQRLVLLVNYRPGYQDAWTSRTYYARLSVDPLLPGQVDELLEALLGSATSLAAVKQMLRERSGGNTLFVEESVRSLVETGALDGQSGAYRLNHSITAIEIPATVHSLLSARIDRLPPEDKQVLECAAVIGREIARPLLQSAAGVTDEELSRVLTNLQASELVYQTQIYPDAEYAFKHALTHEVTYAGLVGARRQLLHRHVAEAIETRYRENVAEYSEVLADHFDRARLPGTAAGYYVASTQRARARYAYSAAQRHCARCIELARTVPELLPQLSEALVLAADIASLQDDLERANQSYKEAADLVPDKDARQRIENKLHRQHVVHRDGAKLACFVHGAGRQTLLVMNPVLYGLALFQPVVEKLCQSFRIITLDARGTGASDPLPGPYGVRDHAKDIRAVIEQLADEPVIPVGISRGATVGAHLAAEFPQLVSKLVFLGITARAGGRPWVGEARKLLQQGDLAAALRFYLPTVFSEPSLDEVQEQLLQRQLQLPRETLLNFFEPDPGTDLTSVLPRVQAPTLLMHGGEDRNVPLQEAQIAASLLSNSALYVFPGRCHLPSVTATDEFCEVLRQFVLGDSVADWHRPGVAQ